MARDRNRPTLLETIARDRGVPLMPDVAALAARDMDRWSWRYLRPIVSPLSNAVILMLILVKRLVPIPLSNHDLIDRLGMWFLHRCISVEGNLLLLRHFIVETNLINFVAANCGRPGIEPVTLKPLSWRDLAGNAVIRHDLNIYNLMLDLAEAQETAPIATRTLGELDFSMLEIPVLDGGSTRSKWLNLDLTTGLYMMNVIFCLFTTLPEYERAVNSFQLDESLLGYVAQITGDPVFRTWTPKRFLAGPHLLRNTPEELTWHAFVNEFAHGRLTQMREALRAGRGWPVLTVQFSQPRRHL